MFLAFARKSSPDKSAANRTTIQPKTFASEQTDRVGSTPSEASGDTADGGDQTLVGGAAPVQPRGANGPRDKTLVFCTSYCASRNQWDKRYRRWLDAIRASKLAVDHVLIVDDGSAILPDWPDLQIIEEDSELTPTKSVTLFHFKERLGRRSALDYPGWYRSFSFGAIFAQVNGFNRIIHIESDAFLITTRIINYINNADEGWIAFWCRKWKFPETAIQIISGNSMILFQQAMSRPYSELVGKVIEKELPFTHVERSFTGDRYGEYLDRVPRFADFATQTIEDAPKEYFWWLTEDAPTGIWRILAYPAHFVQKPLPEKWAATKATIRACASNTLSWLPHR